MDAFDRVPDWLDKVLKSDRIGERLFWLSIAGVILWPLGVLFVLVFGGGDARTVSAAGKALGLPVLLLLVITIAYTMIVVPIRQLWRQFRSRREDEESAELLFTLLNGLFWTTLCLILSLIPFGGYLDEQTLSGIAKVLFTLVAVWGALFGFAFFVVYPLHALYRVLFPRREWLDDSAAATDPPESFNDLLVAILVAIAKADGRFTRAELDVILDFFKVQTGYDEARLARVKRQVKRSLDYPRDINSLLETLASGFSYPAHLITVELVFRLVHAKNPPLAAELRLARDIAAALEIRPADLKNIEAKYRDRAGAEAESARERREREQREREERARREQEEARRQAERQRRARFSAKDEQAFAILGLEPGAKFAAIKKNYRKLVTQYHPDKVGHLGEEYRRIATEKTKELNAAYRHLEERFGK